MSYLWLCLVMLPWHRAAAASVEVPRVFCGRVLADARVLYCYGADHGDAAHKRSAPNSDFGTIPYQDSALDESKSTYDVDAAAWPSLTSQKPQEPQKLRESQELLQSRDSKKPQKSQESQDSQESRKPRELRELSSTLGPSTLAPSTPASLRSRRVRGIVDECCYKACYVSELMNYC